jgi:hypothetical protein
LKNSLFKNINISYYQKVCEMSSFEEIPEELMDIYEINEFYLRKNKLLKEKLLKELYKSIREDDLENIKNIVNSNKNIIDEINKSSFERSLYLNYNCSKYLLKKNENLGKKISLKTVHKMIKNDNPLLMKIIELNNYDILKDIESSSLNRALLLNNESAKKLIEKNNLLVLKIEDKIIKRVLKKNVRKNIIELLKNKNKINFRNFLELNKFNYNENLFEKSIFIETIDKVFGIEDMQNEILSYL